MESPGQETSPPSVGPRREAPPTSSAPRWAWGLLALVFAMHAMEAADAQVLSAVLPRIGSELSLDEEQAGWLETAMIVGAAIGAPMIGYLADRWRRPRLLAVAFAGWGVAVIAGGLARSESPLQAARVAAGAGGAGASVIALTLLADAFPRRMRGRAFSGFFLAMPAGTVIGQLVAATAPMLAGWPSAFFAVGAPGLALSLLALLVPEPVRGASEPVDEVRLRLHERIGPSQEDYVDLMVNSSFNYAIFGLAFAAFALAGLSRWFPDFLASIGLEPPASGPVSPLLLIVELASATGLIAGGWLTDAAISKPRRQFLLPGLAMFAAAGLLLAAIYGRSLVATRGGLFAAGAAMNLIVPICFTILAGVTMPNMRGVGFGVAMAAGHVFGDLWAPPLTGWVVETFARPDSMETGFGHLLTLIGAVPIARIDGEPENLVAGLLSILPALLIAGAVLLAGIRHLPRELALMIAKLRAAPSRRA